MHESAHSERHLREVAAELATNASIELSLGETGALVAAAELLPRGSSMYVPAPVQRPFDSNLEIVRHVAAAGFTPVPHLVARGVPSRSGLEAYLRELVEQFGTGRIMLVGGDHPETLGPYASSVDVLSEGVLAGAGIQEVSIASYPEGHPFIPAPAVRADLERKLALAEQQGLGLEIVTQFSFTPYRVVEHCAQLARALPEIPVYVGMAGPAALRRLRRFARRCGVSASVRALRRFGSTAADSAIHTDTGEQMTSLAHFCAARDACNVIGVHLFSFGGILDTARWLRRQCRPA